MYDVVIIGCGVIGCAIAHELAKYKLKTLNIDKENDVCEKTSMANSAIVHSGYDPHPGTLKARFNVEGNKMFDQVTKDLDVEFKRIGSITLAFSKEEVETLKSLQENGNANGVETKLLTAEEVFAMEPMVAKTCLGGLLAPTCGIINPFELTIALMENAMDNGAELKLNSQVTKINKANDHYEIVINDKEIIETKMVVNAAGVGSGKIAHLIGNNDFEVNPRKGEYYVLDHFKTPFVNHTLFPCPSEKGKGVLVTPTTHGNYLIGPTSEFVESEEDTSTDANDLADVKKKSAILVPNIPYNYMIRVFAGLRAVSTTGDFIIEEDKNNKNFYHAAGIQSPGLASSLAIAKYIRELIEKNNKLEVNSNYNPRRRPLIRLNKKSDEGRKTLINKNPKLGRIICRCEVVSEGEILDVIHRNCGATTIKGVKKRVRPGFGKCQGGFCEALVLKILARELNKNPLDIRYGNSDSYILEEATKTGGND